MKIKSMLWKDKEVMQGQIFKAVDKLSKNLKLKKQIFGLSLIESDKTGKIN